MNVQHGGFTFSLQLDSPLAKGGETIQLIDCLPKDMKKPGLPELQKLITEKVEAVWVQGRLMVLFGFSPADEDERSEKAIIEAGFLAWEDAKDADDGYRFSCLDAKGRAKIIFPKNVPKELSKKIGNAFWGLLLSEAAELDDFEGALNVKGVRTPFGVRDGKAFYGEEAEQDIGAEGEGGDFALEPLEVDDEEDTWSSRDFYGNEEDDDDEDEDEEEEEAEDDYYGREDDDDEDDRTRGYDRY